MTEPMTGIDRIREKIVAYGKKCSLAGFASDVGIAPNALEAFIAGKSVPPAGILCAMTKWLSGNASFDPEKNVLIAGSHNAPPLKLGIPLPTYDPEWARTHGPAKDSPYGFTVEPLKHEAKIKPKQKRQGWLGGWL